MVRLSPGNKTTRITKDAAIRVVRINEHLTAERLKNDGNFQDRFPMIMSPNSVLRSNGHRKFSMEPPRKKSRINYDECYESDSTTSNGSSISADFNKPLQSVIALSLKGLSTDDYRQKMLASIRMYRYLGTENYRRTGRTFLQRNLFYVKTYRNADIPEYEIGEDQPPFAWSYPPRMPKVKRSEDAKVARLSDIVDCLKKMRKIQAEVRKSTPYGANFKFNLGTMALFTRMKTDAFFNDKLFRNFLRKSGIEPPFIVPNYYQVEYPVEDFDSNRTTPEKEESVTSSESAESEDKSVDADVKIEYHSLVFKSFRHNLLGGDRLGRVQVFLVYQHKEKYAKPVKIPSSTFTMPVNELTTIFIDLPNIYNKPGMKVHLLIQLDVSDNQSEISVEGRALRNVPGRNIEPVLKKKKKRLTREKTPVWEHCFLGCRTIFFSLDREEKFGFAIGESNLIMIEKECVNNKFYDSSLVPELLNLSKKMHTNPFMQITLGKFVLGESDDESSSSSGSEVDSTSTITPAINGKPVNGDKEKREGSETGSESDEDKLEKEPMTTSIEEYLGRFRQESGGKYVNPRKMVEMMYQMDALRVPENREIIGEWLPMKVPKSIKYRIVCLSEKEEESPDEEQQALLKNPFKTNPTSLTNGTQMNWVTVVQSKSPNQCIICNRKFDHMFALMMHYHCSYPRLSFTFFINRELNIYDSDVIIDVCIDPSFTYTFEVMTNVAPKRRATRPPTYLVAKEHALLLRSQMRMDMTLFCRVLQSIEMLQEEDMRFSRYIDTSCGRLMKMTESYNMNPNSIPQPSYEELVRWINEQVLDFIDVDDSSKKYMCNWNNVAIALGRGNIARAGPYMMHRMFLSIFGEHVRESQQMLLFVSQLVDEVDAGLLTSQEQYDLMCRLKNRDYDPLSDDLNSLTKCLMRYAKKQFKRYQMAVDSASCPSTARREFDRAFRKDPVTMSSNEKHQLFHRILRGNEAISKLDSRRNFLFDPFEFIFQGKVHRVFQDMTPL